MFVGKVKYSLCLLLMSVPFSGCTTVSSVPASLSDPEQAGAVVFVPPPPSSIVDIPVVVGPEKSDRVKKGTRIVIANIEGPCTQEVKTALMRRLTENYDYDVLTRDNLEQILWEAETSWKGKFNTTTGVRLGELLAASYFIVGRVSFCDSMGSILGKSVFDSPFRVLATLQVLDLRTGKVLVSSSSEGGYIPRQILVDFPSSFNVAPEAEDESNDGASEIPMESLDGGENLEVGKGKMFLRSLGGMISAAGPWAAYYTASAEAAPSDSDDEKDDSKKPKETLPVQYYRMRAADDLASGFADRFFARPFWETVEMWWTPEWKYGSSVQYVRLGRCEDAVDFFEQEASLEVDELDRDHLAEYLHNYGVALLCANHRGRAIDKLTSAYRVGNKKSTLKMLGVARKISEWSLTVQPDREDEVESLMKEMERRRGQPLVASSASPEGVSEVASAKAGSQ